MAEETTTMGQDESLSVPAPTPEMSQRRVLGLAIPIIGENVLQTMVSVIDTLIVSVLGATALAGVGLASEIVFFMISIISSVAVGATVIVSRAIGAANRLARQTVGWGLLIAVPLSIAGYLFAPNLVGIFHATAEVEAEGATYLRITGAGMAIMLLTFVFGAVLRGAGDGRTPLYASLVANVVNAITSWALVFGELGLPRLEVAGAAWGSVIARALGALILAWFLMSGRRAVSIAGRSGWRPTLDTLRSLVQVGVPTAMERMATNVGITVLVAIVALIGTNALAAQQIIFTAFSVALLPGMGFATAATALVGQSVGARSASNARDAAAISIRWAMVWSATAGVIFFTLSRPIMSIFTDSPAVIDHGYGAIMALAITLPPWAYQSVYGGSLRALGDARTPMLTNIVATWLAVGIAWVGVTWFDTGLTFVWAAVAATSPIMLLNAPVFRRRLEATRLQIESELPPPAPAP